MAGITRPLAWLASRNRTTVFLVTIGVMLLALFLPGWYGAVLLIALVAGLGALLARTWPVQTPGTRVLRLVVLALLVVAAITKIV